MRDKVEDYIYVHNYIPIELCKTLINECNKKDWKRHTWVGYTADRRKKTSNADNLAMQCTEEQQEKIAPYLINALEDYQIKYSVPGEHTDTRWISKFSPIRFNKYVVGTMMAVHYDHIHSLFDGHLKGIPVLSIVANFNEDYEGAEFMLRDKEIKLKTGDILLFPSSFIYSHQVKEATKGIRYSFVSWAY